MSLAGKQAWKHLSHWSMPSPITLQLTRQSDAASNPVAVLGPGQGDPGPLVVVQAPPPSFPRY